MSSSSPVDSTPASKIQLTVTAPDEATAISVIDGAFRTVADGLGRLSVALEPGIYKVRASAGQVTSEQIVALPPDSPGVYKQLDPLPFASPVPAPATAYTHEYHEQLAAQCSREVHVNAGTGSSIFILARDYASASTTRRYASVLSQNPAQELALLGADGRVVADFGEGAVKGPSLEWWNPSFDPAAACNVQLNPGIYYLSLTLASGETIRQTVVASPGWQTQVFMLQRNYGTASEDRRCDLAGAGILMARLGQGYEPSEAVRLAELIRLGLAGGRKVLHRDAVDGVYQKAENPLLAIESAHLLLAEAEPDLSLLGRVVAHLRLVVGEHPDVEALALKAPVDASNYVFAHPPMLRAGWALVVEASIRRPELVPPGTTSAQMASQMWGDRPWLLWRSPATEALPGGLEAFSPGSATAPDNPAQQASYVSAMQTYMPSSGVAVSRDMWGGPGEPTQPALSDDEIDQLVRKLGLPRANVEALYQKAQSQPPAKKGRKTAK